LVPSHYGSTSADGAIRSIESGAKENFTLSSLLELKWLRPDLAGA
jgi:hypothetical protein